MKLNCNQLGGINLGLLVGPVISNIVLRNLQVLRFFNQIIMSKVGDVLLMIFSTMYVKHFWIVCDLSELYSLHNNIKLTYEQQKRTNFS